MKNLLLMPTGFRFHFHAIKFGERVVTVIYEDLHDIRVKLKKVEEPHDIVFVGPAAVESPADSEWMKVTLALTHAVRGGSKLVAVAPTRDEAAWEAIRMKLIEVMQTIRESRLS